MCGTDFERKAAPEVGELEWIQLRLANANGATRTQLFYFDPEDDGYRVLGELTQRTAKP